MKRFVTTDADQLLADAFEDGSPETLENYYSPAQDEEVYCTTDEREDFEQYHEITLTADVIGDQRDYDMFVRFLVENYGLREV